MITPLRPRRITMLAPFGIRPKGTLSARMLPLAQALVRRGHAVQIIAPPVHNPADAGTTAVFDGVSVTHIARPGFSEPLDTLQQVLCLLRHTYASRPDVLHLFKPKGYSGLAALLVRLLHPTLPLVVDMDDWEGWGGWNDLLPYPRVAKQLFAWQERDLPRLAHAVTVASRTLQSLAWSSGVAPERVFYLPNGIDVPPMQTNAPRLESNQKTLLLYTRFWEFDLRDLIASLVAIVARHPDVMLRVVGKGERGEEQQMLRLAARAGVRQNIDYRGWAEPADIPSLMARADIALVPFDDTLINRARCSAKLLELMAAGLPVVAGRVGQMSEYIQDGQNGVLVAPGNPAALAQATLQLIKDDRLRQRIGDAARTTVAQFAWDRLVPVMERVYVYAHGGL